MVSDQIWNAPRLSVRTLLRLIYINDLSNGVKPMCKIFPNNACIQYVFSSNAEKYGPEKLRIRTLFR